MTPGKFTIKLGERAFECDSPLTFKQLRIVEPAISSVLKNLSTPSAEMYDRMADIILTVTMRIDPAFVRANLDDTQITPDDLKDAFKAICMATGLYKPKAEGDGPTGEAPPTEAPKSQ